MHSEFPVDGQITNKAAPVSSRDIYIIVLFFFFMAGATTSLNDVLIPKMKELFSLNHAQSMLIQSAFFSGYIVMALPTVAIISRFGYIRTMVLGVLVLITGCLLFIPAAQSGQYYAFLGALAIVGGGNAMFLVVTAPLVRVLGPREGAASRLTFATAFGSLGMTVAPYIGSIILLGSILSIHTDTLNSAELSAFRVKEATVISMTYLGIAGILIIGAALLWRKRHALIEERSRPINPFRAFSLLKRPRFAFGLFSYSLYIGAHAAIGSILANYLMLPNTLALSPKMAGAGVALYWGGEMIGRFVGVAILQVVAPYRMLMAAACCAMVLTITSAFSIGMTAAVALVSVGLFNSIMAPMIYTLTLEDLGERAAEGSGLLIAAVLGGVTIPLLMGLTADAWTVSAALLVPATCYFGILAYAIFCRSPQPAGSESPTGDEPATYKLPFKIQ